MKPSATGAISAKAEELRASGIKVYNFSVGDPVLINHPVLIDAAQKVLREGYSPYAPIAGLTALRKSAAEWMNRRYGCRFALNETVVTTGGKFAIYAALQVLVREGDEVLIAAPHWVSYPEMVRLAKGVPVIVQTKRPVDSPRESAKNSGAEWKWTPELLQKAITPKSRVMILNNGCNPTGVLYTREEIGALLKVAAAANLWVISDEVYSEIVFEGNYVSCASFPEMRHRTIVVESCSKNFAMAGWRVGFAFGPEEIIAQIIALQSQSTTGTCFLSQKVALSAVENSEVVSAYVREAMGKRRKLFFQTLSELSGRKIEPAPAALYYFAKVNNVNELLEKVHVALVPGVAFGVEGYARFAFTESEEEIVQGLKKLHTGHFSAG